MSLSDLFSWNTSTSGTINEVPNIFPFPILERDFISTDVVNIFHRILTDVLERTQGVPDDQENLLWDNCIGSESSDGLVTMLSKAMSDKRELYLVYRPDLKVIRQATSVEQTQIQKDYIERGESAIGIFVTFKNYKRTDMVKLYSLLEYYTIASLAKNMNLAKAIQIKIGDLRGSVGLADAVKAKAQALAIAEGLGLGKDVAMDAKDSIETSTPDLTATYAAMSFINDKRSFYLGLPASYLTGFSSKGLGDSGLGDAKATERGLRNYYFSIVKPVIEAIFKVKTKFRSEDFAQILSSLEALKTFDLVSEELISIENKQSIVNRLFDLPHNAKGDAPKAQPVKQVSNELAADLSAV